MMAAKRALLDMRVSREDSKIDEGVIRGLEIPDFDLTNESHRAVVQLYRQEKREHGENWQWSLPLFDTRKCS